MLKLKKAAFILAISSSTLFMSGCSVFDWLVYKYDIPQGNYMEVHHVKKLRTQMTKDQVEFILGRPVLKDSFASDTWYYVYQFKSGRNAKVVKKDLVLHFSDDKLSRVESDYPLSDQFDIPLDKASLDQALSVQENIQVEDDGKEIKP